MCSAHCATRFLILSVVAWERHALGIRVTSHSE